MIRVDLGLKVTAAEHLTERRADGGACDGLSFLKDEVILYAPTDNSRRENFTLAHELGHWLVEQAPEIFDWLFDRGDPEQALETLCDRIAPRLLLAETAVTNIVGGGPIRAQHIVDLFHSSQASIPPCAIALAAHTYPAWVRSSWSTPSQASLPTSTSASTRHWPRAPAPVPSGTCGKSRTVP